VKEKYFKTQYRPAVIRAETR